MRLTSFAFFSLLIVVDWVCTFFESNGVFSDCMAIEREGGGRAGTCVVEGELNPLKCDYLYAEDVRKKILECELFPLWS